MVFDWFRLVASESCFDHWMDINEGEASAGRTMGLHTIKWLIQSLTWLKWVETSHGPKCLSAVW